MGYNSVQLSTVRCGWVQFGTVGYSGGTAGCSGVPWDSDMLFSKYTIVVYKLLSINVHLQLTSLNMAGVLSIV